MKKRKSSLSFTPQKSTILNFFSSTPSTKQKEPEPPTPILTNNNSDDKSIENSQNSNDNSTPSTPLTLSTSLSTSFEPQLIPFTTSEDEKQQIQQYTTNNNEGEILNHQHYIPYYLKNFSLILETVWEKDIHLFNEEEVLKVENFRTLPHHAKLLFVRLITRKGPWFNLSDLKYNEILDIKDAVQCLSRCNLAHQIPVSPEPSLLVDVARCILTMDQLKHIVRECGIQVPKTQSSSPKDHLLSTVSNRIPNSPIVAKCAENMLGKCVKIDEQAQDIFNKINLLYFLNPHQNATTILLNDMEILNSPKYRVWGKVGIGNSKSIFKSREEFNDYQRALVMERESMEAQRSKNDEVCLSLMEESAIFLATNSLKPAPSLVSTPIKHTTTEIIQIKTSSSSSSISKQNSAVETPLNTQEVTQDLLLEEPTTTTSSNSFTTPSTPSSSSSSLSSFPSQSNYPLTPKAPQTPPNNYLLSSPYDFVSNTTQPTLDINTSPHNQNLISTPSEKGSSHEITTSHSSLNLDSLFVISASTFLSQFSAAHIHSRILHYSIPILEKQKRYEEATFHLRTLLSNGYSSSKRGKWWNRLVINLEHLGQIENALSVCEIALKDSTV
eukprot:TRINITY_DN17003_c0_g1_i1.p1 TRINITY_DN17003_c0_g1~~TRINITY_DN17003_c0_g1_i1.p1  ORF type:complete len:611 (-),score=148.91 TRINITY_DN17003_c0_g1_i1:36-1868(-)